MEGELTPDGMSPGSAPGSLGSVLSPALVDKDGGLSHCSWETNIPYRPSLQASCGLNVMYLQMLSEGPLGQFLV